MTGSPNDYHDDPDYEPFRKILRDHMLETWPLALGDDLLGEPVLKRQLHSVKSAAEMTGIDQRRLRKMLDAAGLIPDAQASRPDAWCVFESATPFLDQAVTLLDAKAFAANMGLSRSQLDLLVEDGILQPEIEDAQVKARWNPATGRALLETLMTGAVPLREAHHGWCSPSKSAQRLKITTGAILRAILDHRLTRIARLADRDGFAALYVHHEEVSSLLGAEPPPAMSLETFAKSVDAAAFHARFFTPRTASLHFHRSWQSLNAELRKKGISTFSPDGEDYGTLWRRAEIEALFAPTTL